ncbi:hypothetical protein BDV06DRAFT_128003 [Aspergillus oleicola]
MHLACWICISLSDASNIEHYTVPATVLWLCSWLLEHRQRHTLPELEATYVCSKRGKDSTDRTIKGPFASLYACYPVILKGDW